MPRKKASMRVLAYTIKGRVILSISQTAVAGIRVEAWDKDLIFDDLVGSAMTDSHSAFRITLTRSFFRELFFDRNPDLFFKVFRGVVLIKSTEDSVLWNIDTNTSIVIEVDSPRTTATPNKQLQRTRQKAARR